MKKIYNMMQIACSFILISILAGCVKDTGMKKTRIFTPVFKTAENVRAAIKSDKAEDIVHPGKIYVLGNYIFMNEIGRGVHIIDNANPASPVNKAFINIPGNEDIAVKGNTLYADCFTDLMVIDISDPSNVLLKNYVPGLFSDRQYVFGYALSEYTIITDWIARDTIMDIDVAEGAGIWRNGSFYTNNMVMYEDMFYSAASYDGSKSNVIPSPVGVGGSMARFAIMNEHLYTVTTSLLNVLNITNSSAPQWNKTIPLNNFIETIYPFKDKLFIGSTTGVLIYDVSNPESPVQQGVFQHLQNCDPVIADDNYAYVTLHAGSACGENLNRLEVLDIKDLSQPTLIRAYDLSNPHGLSKDGNILFVCNGDDGLIMFDATDVYNIQRLKKIELPETFDVICYNKIAIVSAKDGLYQYDYSNVNDVRLLSKIIIKQ